MAVPIVTVTLELSQYYYTALKSKHILITVKIQRWKLTCTNHSYRIHCTIFSSIYFSLSHNLFSSYQALIIYIMQGGRGRWRRKRTGRNTQTIYCIKTTLFHYGNEPEAHITSIIQLKKSVSKVTLHHIILSNSRFC